ncbi:hypothetical protein [Pantoea ananatis]|uniref:hypothetical protein n=1 Tax=Pantoea ananas TaxID=553 RepID=UPI0024B63720|nr:hypothetical protein [Pantoea ananatis]MDJ0030356.1 hypothetical protein [Pantoea ananatis]
MTILELKRLEREREALQCWEQIGHAILGRGQSPAEGVSYQTGMTIEDIISAAEVKRRELTGNK